MAMQFKHILVDSEKPMTATDIMCADVDGDGLEDIVCGSWWYAAPDWKRYEIPGIYQSIIAYDVDGDGRKEIIATKRAPVPADKFWYYGLSSDLVWLKPVDPRKGIWKEHIIGRGAGTWPHGIAMGALLPGGKDALVLAYHSAKKEGHFPELFTVPADPTTPNWPHRTLVEQAYGEEMALCDVDGDGNIDVLMGEYWLRNDGRGGFKPVRVANGLEVARLAWADIDGDGRPDMVFCEEEVDWPNKKVPYSRLAWLGNPGNSGGDWPMHVIDTVRCGHSLSVADIDGDGLPEVICGEHLPFNPYEGDARLLVYKQGADPKEPWNKTVVAQGYEHHDGARIIDLGNSKKGIVSHGWAESKYVHLWEIQA